MLKKRIISSSIFTDLDYLDEYVKLQFENNRKIKKKVEIRNNINIYNKKLLFLKKKTITKTDKKLFIRKLEMDSLDSLERLKKIKKIPRVVVLGVKGI